jgi:hypothetical protein
MKDLTHGSIYRQLIGMAAPIAAGMLLQTMYYVVVARDRAIRTAGLRARSSLASLSGDRDAAGAR